MEENVTNVRTWRDQGRVAEDLWSIIHAYDSTGKQHYLLRRAHRKSSKSYVAGERKTTLIVPGPAPRKLYSGGFIYLLTKDHGDGITHYRLTSMKAAHFRCGQEWPGEMFTMTGCHDGDGFLSELFRHPEVTKW